MQECAASPFLLSRDELATEVANTNLEQAEANMSYALFPFPAAARKYVSPQTR